MSASSNNSSIRFNIINPTVSVNNGKSIDLNKINLPTIKFSIDTSSSSSSSSSNYISLYDDSVDDISLFDNSIDDENDAEHLNSKSALTLAELIPNSNINPESINFPIFQPSTTDPPKQGSWALPMMYLNTGNKRQSYWQIGYNDDNKSLITLHGKIGCKAISGNPREILPKDKRNHQQQAWQESTIRFLKKWRKGHRVKGELNSPLMKPMLAKKYEHPRLDRDPDPSNTTISSIKFPVLIDRKIDGIRGCVYLIEGEAISYSRSQVKQSIFLNEHLAEICQLFAYLPSNVGLDGEWFSKDLKFDQIQGAVQSTVNRNKNIDNIQYWIYDLIVPDMCSLKRYDLLQNTYKRYLNDGGKSDKFVIMEKYFAHNHEEIFTYLDNFISEGYEGAMLRHILTSCKNKRDQAYSYYKPSLNSSSRYNNLFKVKYFIEEEFKVVEVTEGKGTNKGKAIFILITDEGKKFRCVAGGTHEQREYWYNNPGLCIGRLYTVKFYEWTKDGKPRFPTGKAFRDSVNKPGVKAY